MRAESGLVPCLICSVLTPLEPRLQLSVGTWTGIPIRSPPIEMCAGVVTNNTLFTQIFGDL